MIERASLREALASLAAEPGDGNARGAVFAQLLSGRLLAALGRPDPESEQPESVVPGELHLLAMPRDDAEPTALCFTGEEPCRRLGFAGPKAVVRLPELWAFLLDRGLRSATIDAGGPVALTLDESDLSALADGSLPPDAAVPTTRVVLAAPRAPVPAAVAAAAAEVAEHGDVLAAHVLEGDAWADARHLVAALELTPGADPEAALARAWATLEPVSTGDGWRLSATVAAPWEAGLIRATGAAEAQARPRREPPSPA